MIGVVGRVPIAVYLYLKKQNSELVRKCLNLKVVLTIECHRHLSKQAWEYMIAYSILDNNEEMGSSEGVDNMKQMHMMASLLKRS
jgi:hypothetical protein